VTRQDVAIYTPTAASFYERASLRGAGAERQTVLLARSLADRGQSVTHIVSPVKDPVIPDGVRLVMRRPTRPGRLGKVDDPWQVWRAMQRADASTYVFRGANPSLGVAAQFCRLRRRRLVFAAANNSDFTLDIIGPSHRERLYRLGLRHIDAIVVQSSDQVAMAREAFPGIPPAVHIPSFVELAEPATAQPEAFLWVGRIVEYKHPYRYLELARAVPEARFRMLTVDMPNDRISGLPIADLRAEAAGIPNLELLDPIPHVELLKLVERSVAIVNTSTLEGMPNVFLEGWARGVPALTLQFDPDGRIAARGLGVSAGGSFEAFAAGARELWAGREARARYGAAARTYIEDVHSPAAVAAAWAAVLAG
jgi:glycosyltransferase involved in cell wall biosynthesis